MTRWEEVEYYPDERDQMALRKKFSFKDFKSAQEFANKVGDLEEEANHHPDLNIGWGYVQVWLTTHSEHSITSKDRDLAEKIDAIYKR